MKSIMLRTVVCLMFVVSLRSVAHASGGTGTVTQISIRNGTNFATVDFTGVVGSHPCGNAPASQFGFDISTAKGKALLSMLESAYLAGKTIGYGGSGACITVEGGLSAEVLSIATISG
jgi:hypothetical protein